MLWEINRNIKRIVLDAESEQERVLACLQEVMYSSEREVEALEAEEKLSRSRWSLPPPVLRDSELARIPQLEAITFIMAESNTMFKIRQEEVSAAVDRVENWRMSVLGENYNAERTQQDWCADWVNAWEADYEEPEEEESEEEMDEEMTVEERLEAEKEAKLLSKAGVGKKRGARHHWRVATEKGNRVEKILKVIWKLVEMYNYNMAGFDSFHLETTMDRMVALMMKLRKQQRDDLPWMSNQTRVLVNRVLTAICATSEDIPNDDVWEKNKIRSKERRDALLRAGRAYQFEEEVDPDAYNIRENTRAVLEIVYEGLTDCRVLLRDVLFRLNTLPQVFEMFSQAAERVKQAEEMRDAHNLAMGKEVMSYADKEAKRKEEAVKNAVEEVYLKNRRKKGDSDDESEDEVLNRFLEEQKKKAEDEEAKKKKDEEEADKDPQNLKRHRRRISIILLNPDINPTDFHAILDLDAKKHKPPTVTDTALSSKDITSDLIEPATPGTIAKNNGRKNENNDDDETSDNDADSENESDIEDETTLENTKKNTKSKKSNKRSSKKRANKKNNKKDNKKSNKKSKNNNNDDKTGKEQEPPSAASTKSVEVNWSDEDEDDKKDGENPYAVVLSDEENIVSSPTVGTPKKKLTLKEKLRLKKNRMAYKMRDKLPKTRLKKLESAVKIQTCARGWLARQLVKRVVEYRKRMRRNSAALTIQTQMRRYFALLDLRRRSVSRFTIILNPLSQEMYYFDFFTGKRMYRKPKALGPIVLPRPKMFKAQFANPENLATWDNYMDKMKKRAFENSVMSVYRTTSRKRSTASVSSIVPSSIETNALVPVTSSSNALVPFQHKNLSSHPESPSKTLLQLTDVAAIMNGGDEVANASLLTRAMVLKEPDLKGNTLDTWQLMTVGMRPDEEFKALLDKQEQEKKLKLLNEKAEAERLAAEIAEREEKARLERELEEEEEERKRQLLLEDENDENSNGQKLLEDQQSTGTRTHTESSYDSEDESQSYSDSDDSLANKITDAMKPRKESLSDSVKDFLRSKAKLQAQTNHKHQLHQEHIQKFITCDDFTDYKDQYDLLASFDMKFNVLYLPKDYGVEVPAKKQVSVKLADMQSYVPLCMGVYKNQMVNGGMVRLPDRVLQRVCFDRGAAAEVLEDTLNRLRHFSLEKTPKPTIDSDSNGVSWFKPIGFTDLINATTITNNNNNNTSKSTSTETSKGKLLPLEDIKPSTTELTEIDSTIVTRINDDEITNTNNNVIKPTAVYHSVNNGWFRGVSINGGKFRLKKPKNAMDETKFVPVLYYVPVCHGYFKGIRISGGITRTQSQIEAVVDESIISEAPLLSNPNANDVSCTSSLTPSELKIWYYGCMKLFVDLDWVDTIAFGLQGDPSMNRSLRIIVKRCLLAHDGRRIADLMKQYGPVITKDQAQQLIISALEVKRSRGTSIVKHIAPCSASVKYIISNAFEKASLRAQEKEEKKKRKKEALKKRIHFEDDDDESDEDEIFTPSSLVLKEASKNVQLSELPVTSLGGSQFPNGWWERHPLLFAPRPIEMDKHAAARVIQGMVHRRQMRAVMVDKMFQIYRKLYDPVSGNFYYLNVRRKTTSFTKPALLRNYDLPDPPKKAEGTSVLYSIANL
eukprot:TRINITY_DN1648_c0_g1_i3.p1 TRINITY_DN1648_c0_g1~~TRINITY_DN1648_c0_g1_i3.p1  ORF type:complete len:1623 (-),score=595.56 TRINITY_DN1648_c0_g1_i3:282-5150(-)